MKAVKMIILVVKMNILIIQIKFFKKLSKFYFFKISKKYFFFKKMISFNKGIPFAIIKGGQYDGQILNMIDDASFKPEENEKIYKDPIDFLDELGFFQNMKRRPKQFEELRQLIVSKDGYIDPDIEELYNKARKTIIEKAGKEFFLSDEGTLQLIPNLNGSKREILYAAGSAGSGKTKFACDYLSYYQSVFKHRKVFIFTNDVKDPTIINHPYLDPIFIDLTETISVKEAENQKKIEGMMNCSKLREAETAEEEEERIEEYRRVENPIDFDLSCQILGVKPMEGIAVDIPQRKGAKPPKKRRRTDAQVEKDIKKRNEFVPTIWANPIEPQELENSAILIDDIDFITDKKVNEALYELQNKVMGVGRHFNTTIFMTGHQICNYVKTRLILAEVDWVIVYPKSGPKNNLEYFFDNKLKIKDKEFLKKIINLPSRWAAIHVKHPMYVVHEKGVFVIANNFYS